jgi:transposase-like protein
MKAILAAFARANAGAAQPAKSRSPALRRGGKLHTMMISDVRKDTLLPIIRHKVVPDSIVYSDSYPAYDVLDVSEFHATGTCEPSNAGPNLRPSQPNLGRPQRKITVRLPLVCLKATAVTTPSRRERPSARSSRFELDGLTRTAMKFTVTCRVGVTEVVDRPESARAALEHVLVQLGRKRNDVRIFDEDGRPRTPADLCRLAAREVATLPDHQD